MTQGSRASLEIRSLNFEDGTGVLEVVPPDVVGITDPISTNGDLLVVRIKRKNQFLWPPCNWFEFITLDGSSAVDNPYPGKLDDCLGRYRPYLGKALVTDQTLDGGGPTRGPSPSRVNDPLTAISQYWLKR